MKTISALTASAVSLMITLWLPLPGNEPEANDPARAAPEFHISRPGDAAVSCNVLMAEIDQLSTEVQLWSAAETNAAKSSAMKRRLLHLTALKQRSCAPGQGMVSHI